MSQLLVIQWSTMLSSDALFSLLFLLSNSYLLADCKKSCLAYVPSNYSSLAINELDDGPQEVRIVLDDIQVV